MTVSEALDKIILPRAREEQTIWNGVTYWNIDNPLNKNLRRNQRRYKVRGDKIIRMDSPKNIEKAQRELAPF